MIAARLYIAARWTGCQSARLEAAHLFLKMDFEKWAQALNAVFTARLRGCYHAM